MVYQVEIDKKACKDIEALPPDIAKRISAKLSTLQMNPFPHGNTIVELRGYKDLYRLRVGDYRVIFERGGNSVRVIMVAHRGDVYKRLKQR